MRQLSAIFDTRALGYTSSLVAARYPDDRLFEAADIVGGHPGREPQLPAHPRVQPLVHAGRASPTRASASRTRWTGSHEASGAESTRLLPTLKLYKINVQLDMTGTRSIEAKEDGPEAPADARRRRAADRGRQGADRVLQRDLPVEPQPFDAWADDAGVTADELLAACQVFVDRNYMRRFAAVLNHRKAGLRRQRHGGVAGARGGPRGDRARAWPPSRPSRTATSGRPTRTGRTASSRWSTPRSKEACEEAIDAIAEDIGITDPVAPRDPLLDLRVQEDPAHVLHAGLPRVGGLGARRRAPPRWKKR